jgi:hypothetical protein
MYWHDTVFVHSTCAFAENAADDDVLDHTSASFYYKTDCKIK